MTIKDFHSESVTFARVRKWTGLSGKGKNLRTYMCHVCMLSHASHPLHTSFSLKAYPLRMLCCSSSIIISFSSGSLTSLQSFRLFSFLKSELNNKTMFYNPIPYIGAIKKFQNHYLLSDNLCSTLINL